MPYTAYGRVAMLNAFGSQTPFSTSQDYGVLASFAIWSPLCYRNPHRALLLSFPW